MSEPEAVDISTELDSTRQAHWVLDVGLRKAKHGDVLGALDIAREEFSAGRVPDFVNREDGKLEIDDSKPLAMIAGLEAVGVASDEAIRQAARVHGASNADVWRWRRKRREGKTK
jgi:hypothetical protein